MVSLPKMLCQSIFQVTGSSELVIGSSELENYSLVSLFSTLKKLMKSIQCISV